jgi:tripartite-type tricarboxylate transporter receptor subunit TctC
MVHIPYKGTGPAINDLLGGSVDLTFGTPPPFMGHLQAGKLRALAVTGKSRLPSLPETPTAAEAGYPKLYATSWFGLYAPAGTPPAIVDRLSSEIAKVVESPEFKRKAQEQVAVASYMDPKEFAQFTRAELERWSEVVKSANIRAD